MRSVVARSPIVMTQWSVGSRLISDFVLVARSGGADTLTRATPSNVHISLSPAESRDQERQAVLPRSYRRTNLARPQARRGLVNSRVEKRTEFINERRPRLIHEQSAPCLKNSIKLPLSQFWQDYSVMRPRHPAGRRGCARQWDGEIESKICDKFSPGAKISNGPHPIVDPTLLHVLQRPPRKAW